MASRNRPIRRRFTCRAAPDWERDTPAVHTSGIDPPLAGKRAGRPRPTGAGVVRRAKPLFRNPNEELPERGGAAGSSTAMVRRPMAAIDRRRREAQPGSSQF